MRGLVTLLVVSLAALAGWFFFAGDSQPALDAASLERSQAKTRPELEPADLSQPDAEARSENLIATSASPASETELPPEPGNSPDVASAKVSVAGRVVLIDLEDNRFEAESGSLEIAFTEDELGELEVAVENGRFSFEADVEALFRVQEVLLGGESCGLSSQVPLFAAKSSSDLQLEVYRRVPASLIVRDAETGLDLSGLEVWNRADWEFSDPLNPSKASGGQRVLENQTSPIRLPVRDGRQAWWVGAEGYAWERVDFDHRFGGERVVVLQREAAIQVRFVGAGLAQLHALRVQRVGLSFGGGPGLVRETKGADHHSVDGLREGSWSVSGLVAGPSEEAEVLGSATVELKAGEALELTVSLDRVISANAIRVAGTLELPPEALGVFRDLSWSAVNRPGSDSPNRGFVYVSAPFETVGTRKDLFAWETDELSPGEWDVEVIPFGRVERIVIGAAGASGIALRVPPLAEIIVEVRSAATGELIEGASVDWQRIQGEDFHHAGEGEPTDESGKLRLLATPGDVRISAHGRGYSSSNDPLTVHAGHNRMTVSLHQSVTAVLTLRDGKTVVKSEIDWWLEMQAEAVGTEDSVRSYSFDGSAEMTAEFSGPGTYRFTFADVDGYRPVEPIEVVLDRGEVRIDVQLLRE